MAEPAFVEPDTTFPTDDFSRYRLLDLFKEVRLLMIQRHALEYRLIAILRELDKRDDLDGRPLHLASWLARNFAMGYGAAREKVRTSRALGHLPLIDAAFREGKLSYSKVRALTRVANTENESELLTAAASTSADAVEHIVRLYRQRERLDDVQEMLRQRSLTYAWDEDGSLVVKARLTPEQGAIWIQAMDKAESTADRDSSEAFSARRADAMTQALEDTLNEHPSTKSSSTGDRYQVVVHVPAETFSVGSTSKPPAIAPLVAPLIAPPNKERAPSASRDRETVNLRWRAGVHARKCTR